MRRYYLGLLTILCVFPFFLGGLMYRMSQMIDYDEPGPILGYRILSQQHPIINVLASITGIMTGVAILCLAVGLIILLASGIRQWPAWVSSPENEGQLRRIAFVTMTATTCAMAVVFVTITAWGVIILVELAQFVPSVLVVDAAIIIAILAVLYDFLRRSQSEPLTSTSM